MLSPCYPCVNINGLIFMVMPTITFDVYVHQAHACMRKCELACVQALAVPRGRSGTLERPESGPVHFIKCLPDYILPWGMLSPLARSKHDYTRID